MNSVYQWCVGSISGEAWERVIIRLTRCRSVGPLGGGMDLRPRVVLNHGGALYHRGH